MSQLTSPSQHTIKRAQQYTALKILKCIFIKSIKIIDFVSNGHLIPFSMNFNEISRNVQTLRWPGHSSLPISLFLWLCSLYFLENYFYYYYYLVHDSRKINWSYKFILCLEKPRFQVLKLSLVRTLVIHHSPRIQEEQVESEFKLLKISK